MSVDISLRRGDRGLIVGQSGSGKTFVGIELCRAMPRPLVVIDTKYSAGIADLVKEDSANWSISEGAFPVITKETRCVIWRPDPDTLSDPLAIDAPLVRLVDNHRACSVYIDEMYQLHKAGRPGPGIVGLFTRGREMGFCTLGGAQRPSWVSLFCMTESNRFYVMKLALPADRKRVAEVLGEPDIEDVLLPPRWFWYMKEGEDLELIEPLTIRKKSDRVAKKDEPKRFTLI